MKASTLLPLALSLGFFYTLALSQPRPATAAVALTEEGPFTLAGHVEMAWDPSGLAPFEGASRALPFSSVFEAQPTKDAVLWARFTVRSEAQARARWILRSERFLSYQSVELYRPSLPTARFDKETPVAARAVPDVQPAFRVELMPQEEQVLYLRIEPNDDWDFISDPAPMLRLIPERQWLSLRFTRFIGQSAFFTFLLVSILYQLLTVIIEFDRSRLWYISLLSSYVVYFAFLSNFSAEFFSVYLSEVLFASLGVPWVALSYAGFLSSFLDLRSTYPKTRAALFALSGAMSLNSAIDVSLRLSTGNQLNEIMIPLGNTEAGILMILALGVTIQRAREGYRPARLFLAASGSMALSGLVVVAMFLGLYSGDWGPSVFQLGVVVECLILSVAVTNRLRWIRKEKEQSLAMLEQHLFEVQSLKSELDHQLAARSRELTQLLASSSALPLQQQLAPGDIFEGRYRTIKPIGKGGMGAVFMVERLTDQKKLALKILRGGASGVDAARFTREAEISARMTHPNLVKLFDVGLSSGSPYIVMELIEAGSLDEQRAHFGEVEWMLPLLSGIAKGLAALHQAGIVHRDLKPSNILLEEQNGSLLPKIADFGISRYEGDGAFLESRENSSGTATTMGLAKAGQQTPDLTATGAILGTPRYMPPEAAQGARAAGPAWDIFSFGVMACEMLTGRVPFEGVPVRLALQGKPLPPIVVSLESLPAIPKHIAKIIGTCLAAEVKERPTASILEDCFAAL